MAPYVPLEASLGAPRAYLTPGLQHILVADFDGDGVLDLLVLDADADFHRGLGDTDFDPVARVSTLSLPTTYAAASGDFDGDGKRDLAILTTRAVSVFLGHGDGTFGPPIDELDLTSGFPQVALAAGALDRDGIDDLALAVAGGPILGTLLGSPDAGMRGWVAPDAGGPTLTSDLELADLNGDGTLDVIVHGYSSGFVAYLGLGDGGLQVVVGADGGPLWYAGSSTAPLPVADLNADGIPDVLEIDTQPGSVAKLTEWLGNGDGTFTAGTVTPTASSSAALFAAGDVTGDGLVDLAEASAPTQLYVRMPDGGLAPPTSIASANSGYPFLAQDLDGDGRAELVRGGTTLLTSSSGYSVEVERSDDAGRPVTGEQFTPPDAGTWAVHVEALADLLGRGTPQVLTWSNDTLTLYSVEDGAAHVESSCVEDAGAFGLAVVGDFLESGTQQVILRKDGYNNSALVTFAADGGGCSFGPDLQLGYGNSNDELAVDLDGDGHLDIVQSDFFGIALARGLGGGAFAPYTEYQLAHGSVWSPESADFDGDGRRDVAAVSSDGQIMVLLNQGDGGLGPELDTALGVSGDQYPLGLVADDFDGDGTVDVVVATGYAGTLEFGKGLGDGTFQVTPIADLPQPNHLASLDLDRDGCPDLLVASEYNGLLAALRGHCDGTFDAPLWFVSGSETFDRPLIGDLDADGRWDVVTSGARGASVIWGR